MNMKEGLRSYWYPVMIDGVNETRVESTPKPKAQKGTLVSKAFLKPSSKGLKILLESKI